MKLKKLFYIQVKSLLNFYFKCEGKKRTKAEIVLDSILILIILAGIGLAFGYVFHILCNPLCESGFNWLYFALVALIVMVICLSGSIFFTQSYLFENKDNELLFSMPIPVLHILLSRILTLLLLEYSMMIVIVIPAGIVYILNQPFTLLGVLLFVLCFLLQPFLVLALTSLIGWILFLINLKLRKWSVLITCFSLMVIGVCGYIYSNIGHYTLEIIDNGEIIGIAFKQYLLPLYYLGLVITENSFASLMIYLAYIFVPFILVCLVLAKSMIYITTKSPSVTNKRLSIVSMKKNNIMTALVKKELNHFASSPIYMLNGALGIVFTIVFTIVLIFRHISFMEFFSLIPGWENLMVFYLVFIFGFLATLNLVSTPSISMEGKNIWILQSIPFEGGKILIAKALAHISICFIPSIFSSIVSSYLFAIDWLEVVVIFLIPFLLNTFQAFLGILLNLYFPRFDWTSEALAIKQGFSSIFTMIISMLVIIGAVIFYMGVLWDDMEPSVFMIVFSGTIVLVIIAMIRWLFIEGNRKFSFLK